MDKITENANNLAKAVATTMDYSQYIPFIDPKTGEQKSITLTNLAQLVIGLSATQKTPLTSGGVYESVDLGLPSGTLWAKHNIGATKESDYGDLFAWGATEPYRLNGSTPIDNTDNYANSYANTIQHDLYPNEDAATVHWGKGWKMPTKAQFDELLANTTDEWTAINGINGRKFTASNGKYIFFPAAGHVGGGSLGYRGSYGRCWSRSRYSSTYAWRLNFGSSGRDVSTTDRGNGFSVRPVRS